MNVRKFVRDIAGLDDPPHKIAMGLALGIFIGFVPIMGIQMAVVLPFALLFRANKTAAIGGVWVTNPVTVIPIYYLDYKIGELIVTYPPLTWGDFKGLFSQMTLHRFLELGEAILVPLFVGGMFVGVVAAIPTYFITRRLVIRSRERKARARAKRGETPAAP